MPWRYKGRLDFYFCYRHAIYPLTLCAISRWTKLAIQMKQTIRWTFIIIAFTACNHKGKRTEILTAKFTDKGITTTSCLFRMFSDSTYTFDLHEYQEYRHEKNETFRGRYHLKGDSIIFFPMEFDFLDAETAMIKNDFLEFVDGKMPFKMKIVMGQENKYKGIDTVTYNDFSLFTYDTAFYHQFPKDMIPYDLNNDDLKKIENILASCVKNANLSFELRDYFKQCIAVKNKKGEREVWINFLCHPGDIEEFKYFVIHTNDGGDCYFNVKLNLDKEECYDFWVNGHA